MLRIRKQPLLLTALSSIALLYVSYFTEFGTRNHQHLDVTVRSRFKVSEKISRYIHLTQLNGTFLESRNVTKINCEDPSIPLSAAELSGLHKYEFYGTRLFSVPEVNDLPSKICQFKNGATLSMPYNKEKEDDISINQPHLCDQNELHLLILVKSAHKNAAGRSFLRKSWLDNRLWKGLKIKHVFVLGTGATNSENAKIIKEAVSYGDIIQQDFLDSYYNNTRKMVFALKWAVAFCPEAKWLLFVDDDMTLFTKRLSLIITKLLRSRTHNVLLGQMLVNSEVYRDHTKWIIRPSEYPHPRYPSFVSGVFYLMNPDLAMDLYVASRFTKHIPFDDAFIGLLCNKLLIAPNEIGGIIIYGRYREMPRDILGFTAVHRFEAWLNAPWLWRKVAYRVP